jgi:exonuclease III
MRTKIKATMLEGDDILLLTNTQIGRNRRLIEKEFLIGGENPYVIYTNSSASDARGVLIAIRLQADIQVIDTAKDDEDRILILKIAKGNETLTIGCVYDDNRNNTRTLNKIEELLERLDSKQGLIIAGDYNVIINEDLDQFGYENHHHRTKAIKIHQDWEKSGSLVDIYRKKFKNGKAVTYVPDTEHNRENPKLGRRLDKFLVSEDLNIKESEVIHTSDNYYKTQLNMKKKFDHGAVRLLYNKQKPDIGPGQFKLDPYLVSCGALDSVIKEVIYEANIYNSNIPEIMEAYTERNKIAVPLMNTLIEIQKQRKQEQNPAIREDEENNAVKKSMKPMKNYPQSANFKKSIRTLQTEY